MFQKIFSKNIKSWKLWQFRGKRRSYCGMVNFMKIQRKIKIKIPKSFQGILWSVNVKNLDLEKDKVYIIHQILMYGTIKQIHWLFKVYGKKIIKEVFLKDPQRIYNPPAFLFLKNFILGFKKIPLSKKIYVTSIF